jgi:hypothetical protein
LRACIFRSSNADRPSLRLRRLRPATFTSAGSASLPLPRDISNLHSLTYVPQQAHHRTVKRATSCQLRTSTGSAACIDAPRLVVPEILPEIAILPRLNRSHPTLELHTAPLGRSQLHPIHVEAHTPGRPLASRAGGSSTTSPLTVPIYEGPVPPRELTETRGLEVELANEETVRAVVASVLSLGLANV